MLFTITQLRQVVDELRALVEKRGVVFVALDDEILRVVEARALPEIRRHAADHVARLAIRPRSRIQVEQRGRGRFPVRAGDDEIVPAAQEKLLQHLRQREVVELAVEHRFDFRIAALDRVADHDDLGVGRNIFRAITLGQRDALGLEEVDIGG